MNGEYYQNPIFPGLNQPNNNFSIPENKPLLNNNNFDLNINSILKNNNNKKVTIYTTIPNSKENQDKSFSGTIEKAGKDNVIIYNPQDGKYYLIPINYINYIIFDEKIN